MGMKNVRIFPDRTYFKGVWATKVLSAANQWAGQVVINSGQATATLSTSWVTSDSVILLGPTVPLSAAFGPVCVRTVSDQGFFMVGPGDGATVNQNVSVSFIVFRGHS